MTYTSKPQQPEALRLADKYEVEGFLQDHRFAQEHWCRQAAAELRRQHARIEELEAELAAEHGETARAIGAQLGIGLGKPALTGAEIELLDDAALRHVVTDVDVFARASDYETLQAECDKIKADRKACWEEFKRFRRTADETERELRADVEGLRKQVVRRAPAAPVPQWVRPVSELLGHISDVLPDNAFNKIDTAKWNAVSALVGATTQAADAPVVLPEPAAWMLGCQTMGGGVGWKLSFSQPGAGVCQRLKGEEFEERLYTEQQVRATLGGLAI